MLNLKKYASYEKSRVFPKTSTQVIRQPCPCLQISGNCRGILYTGSSPKVFVCAVEDVSVNTTNKYVANT